MDNPAGRALYDNLGQSACLGMDVDAAVLDNHQGDWCGNTMKIKRVRLAIMVMRSVRAPRSDTKVGQKGTSVQ